MKLNDLTHEILSQCFSYLDTKSLLRIIKIENVSDHILDSALEHLNQLCFADHAWDSEDGVHYKYDLDEFREIHNALCQRSKMIPLWFKYYCLSVFTMYQAIEQIKSCYKGQKKLGLSFNSRYLDNQCFSILSNDVIITNVTHLTFKCFYHADINLDKFIHLVSFHGEKIDLTVRYDHANLTNIRLINGRIHSLPVVLTELNTLHCEFLFGNSQPRLCHLKVLILDDFRNGIDYNFLRSFLWNQDLETFSIKNQQQTEIDVFRSLESPKLKHVGFSGTFTDPLPLLLRSIYCGDGKLCEDMSVFSRLTTLELQRPCINLGSFILPSSLLRLSISSAANCGVEKIQLPSSLVELKLNKCGITTINYLPSNLRRLSLDENEIKEFSCLLPNCKYLRLSGNELKSIHIEAPFLELISLDDNELSSIPDLPGDLETLLMSVDNLDLTDMGPLPRKLRTFTLSGTKETLKNYTFPSSMEDLDLTGLTNMSGVTFAKDSKLKMLDLSSGALGTINDDKIRLPKDLEQLDLFGNNLETVKDLDIPDSLRYLDLGGNKLKFFEIGSKLQTLSLKDNPIGPGLVLPINLDLRVLNLINVGLEEFSFELIKAKKLIQLSLGQEVRSIDFSSMPESFQVLKYEGILDHPEFILQPRKEDGINTYWRLK